MVVLVTGLRMWMFLSSDFVWLLITSFIWVYFLSIFCVSGAVLGIWWQTRMSGTYPFGTSQEGRCWTAVSAPVSCLAQGRLQSVFAEWLLSELQAQWLLRRSQGTTGSETRRPYLFCWIRRCSGWGVSVPGHSELRRTLGLRAGSSVKT